MNWTAAVLIETKTEFILRSLYIKAENAYEANGKAHITAARLWPGGKVSVSTAPADQRHLIHDPLNVTLED